MRVQGLLPLLPAALLFGVAACATAPRSPESTVMLRHFDHARTLSAAAIFGRVGEAHDAAEAIRREGPLMRMPEQSEEYFDAFQESVAKVESEVQRQALAHDAAEVARRCGDCHLASGLGPTFDVGRPEEATSLRDHMRVHSWASARMWEGLIGGSDLAWRAGARALSGQTMRAQLYEARVSDIDEAGRLTAAIHEVGVNALAATEREEKTELLGELWATCSRCHELAGVR